MWLLMIAVVCAYIIKGMSGIGNTLVFSTIMSFRMNNINISPVDLIVGYPSNLYIAWKERKHIVIRIWLPLAVMVLVGSVPGILFLKLGNTILIKTVFGFVITLIGFEMLLRGKTKDKKPMNQAFLSCIGITAGLLCGMFGIGAFLAAYTSRVTNNKGQFRGNTCMVFLIENSIRILLYSLLGILNLAVFRTAIQLIPFMILGLSIGVFLSNRSSEKFVINMVIVLLILSGISLIYNNLRVMIG